MLRLHREPWGAVFHFADGVFIRCINRWHKESEVVLNLERVSIPREIGCAIGSAVYGAFLEHKDGSRRCIWTGGRIHRVSGRRFPNIFHYFFPGPGIKEALG